MGRRHRQPVAVGGEDRRGGNELSRGALAVGEMGFADLLPELFKEMKEIAEASINAYIY
jgi:hypothetical protein